MGKYNFRGKGKPEIQATRPKKDHQRETKNWFDVPPSIHDLRVPCRSRIMEPTLRTEQLYPVKDIKCCGFSCVI
jgi:hypothetical protein